MQCGGGIAPELLDVHENPLLELEELLLVLVTLLDELVLASLLDAPPAPPLPVVDPPVPSPMVLVHAARSEKPRT